MISWPYYRSKLNKIYRSSELLIWRFWDLKLVRVFIAEWLLRFRTKDFRALASPNVRRNLYVDISVIAVVDAGTGIQRVVRELALALEAEAYNWDIQFVAASRKHVYRTIDWPVPRQEEGQSIRMSPGDVFLGLDYSVDTIVWHRRQLAKFRRQGGSIWFLVHDLLPLHSPQWFSTSTAVRFRRWLDVLAHNADGFFCNSAQTEMHLRAALGDRYNLWAGYETAILPMGHRVSEDNRSVAKRLGLASSKFSRVEGPYFLMVGTLEPRKGHEDMVQAFTALWSEGFQDKLVLIGRAGWKVDDLQSLIKQHPQYGTNLFWFHDVEDHELIKAYGSCSGVIVASRGEGFGLPVIEALGYGKPVLARNLSVFAQHVDNGASLFPVEAPVDALVSDLRKWMGLVKSGVVKVRAPQGSWPEAARMLMERLESAPLPIPADKR